jgi:DNA-binding SARP family transcriptional activator
MATLEIRMFGTLRVLPADRPMSRFPTKRVKDLFSYLLLQRHTLHSREALAELFWDGTRGQNPRHCLNTALWRLNRVLGEAVSDGHPYLRVDANFIGFNTASDIWLDVAEFENRCLWAEQLGSGAADQQAALYQQAIALYQGDLLVDCYEEWCLVERERLQRMYLCALEFLIDHHIARAEHVETADCAMRLLACDPLREDVHRKLIESYLADSQPTAAFRQYHACEAALRRELGSAPSPETQALLRVIFERIGTRTGGAARQGGQRQRIPAAAAGSTPVVLLADRADHGDHSGHGGHGEDDRQLNAAVAQLGHAVAEFERAETQLRDAVASVEGLARHLMAVADEERAGAHTRVPARQQIAAGHVRRAAELVVAATSRLAAVR